MSEHVVLADCRDGNNVLSSQIAYFPTIGGNTPQDVATVVTTSGQTALWVCSTTTALFTDTNTQFVAKIGPKVADGAFAGTGSNGFDSNNGGFRCWQQFSPQYYTYGNTTCNMVYDCTHRLAPSNTASATCGTATATVSASENPSSTSDLATGAVIGISVGAGIAFVVALGAACIVWKHMRRKNRNVTTGLRADQTSKNSFFGILKSAKTPPIQQHLALADGNMAHYINWHHPYSLHEMDGQGHVAEASASTAPLELGEGERIEMPTLEVQHDTRDGKGQRSRVNRPTRH
ncbi:hypothetical protein JX265_002633 [Neoarthrinium moseri]|uniref:Uncharacterized protein n=1 Tax=Neoarthrinium moseri TaxID=1658444 RepID=A0A9P9WUT0_9PEZI|nr:hypothetical protein JX265_002633 [Neoarthrinium moseri]